MLGKTKKEGGTADNPTIRTKTANRLAVYLYRMQQSFALFMGKRINKLTRRGKKIFLVMFCLLFGGSSLFVILGIFIGRHNKSFKAMKPVEISVPRYFNKAGDENTSTTVVITEDEIKQIKDFNRYMDSLQLSASGKKIHDSILLIRPGLMDSIRMLEQVYIFQQKNK